MLNAYVILSVLFIFTNFKPKISIANFWVRKMHAELLGILRSNARAQFARAQLRYRLR